jgi:hypothetical protein
MSLAAQDNAEVISMASLTLANAPKIAHSNHRIIICLMVLIFTLLMSMASKCEVFTDDFNRPDGPLSDPWNIMSSYLYIESQRVVANAYELGNMYRLSDLASTWASIEYDLCFNGDSDGRYHLYIGGGEDESSAWGFTGIVGIGFVEISRIFYSGELATDYYVPDTGEEYHAKLEYLDDIGRVSLSVVDHLGNPVVQIDAPVTPDGPFLWCAMGIENIGTSADNQWLDNVLIETDGSTGVDGLNLLRVSGVYSYPNPFNAKTSIVYNTSQRVVVGLRVFDVSGQLVRVLLDDEVAAKGRHETAWDGRCDSGKPAPSGTYFYRLTAGSYSETRRMVLVK